MKERLLCKIGTLMTFILMVVMLNACVPGTSIVTEGATEVSTEEVTEGLAEASTEGLAEASTEGYAEVSTEEPTEVFTEAPTNESTGTSTEEMIDPTPELNAAGPLAKLPGYTYTSWDHYWDMEQGAEICQHMEY